MPSVSCPHPHKNAHLSVLLRTPIARADMGMQMNGISAVNFNLFYFFADAAMQMPLPTDGILALEY